MRNYLLFIMSLFLLTLSLNSHAFKCRNGVTGEIYPGGGNNMTEIYVPVEDNVDATNLGENIFANVGQYFECYNDYGFGTDFLDVIEIISGPDLAANNLLSGVYIKGSKYYSTTPLGNGVNAFSLTTKEWQPLDIGMFYDTFNAVGPLLLISKGQVIMTLKLKFHSTNDGNTANYTWTFKSLNDVFLATGNCSINNNQVLDVDFGEVSKTSISTVGTSTRYQIDKEIEYDCNDPRLNQNIKISLSANRASFSNSAFETTTSGLGVEMYHDSKVIPPYTGFNSYLSNGIGRDVVTFTLVKTNNPGPDDLKEGGFSAGASLIISEP